MAVDVRMFGRETLGVRGKGKSAGWFVVKTLSRRCLQVRCSARLNTREARAFWDAELSDVRTRLVIGVAVRAGMSGATLTAREGASTRRRLERRRLAKLARRAAETRAVRVEDG